MASGRVLRIDEHVAGAAVGADIARLFGIVAELPAQGGNVDVDAAVEHFPLAVANVLKEVIPGEHATFGFGEADEEIELDGAQDDNPAIHRGDAGGGTDVDAANDDVQLVAGSRSGGREQQDTAETETER